MSGLDDEDGLAIDVEPNVEPVVAAPEAPEESSAVRVRSPIPVDVVTVDPTRIKRPAAEPTTEYWVGLKNGAGFDFVTRGGIDFPRAEGVNALDTKGRPLGATTRGKRVHLTQAQVARICDAVAKTIIRNLGPEKRCLLNVDGPSFRFRADDEPLGRYLWMVRVKATMPVDWTESDPPSMCD